MESLLEIACSCHKESIRQLVNEAYRGDSGWTRETDLVGGDRVSDEEIQGYLDAPSAHLLVAVVENAVRGCICVEQKDESAYIGMFAIDPALQGKGLGKNILVQAEQYAVQKFHANKFVMVVVSQRKELIAYYERRGYLRTGKQEAYPAHLDVGEPLQNNLTIEYLEKRAK